MQVMTTFMPPPPASTFLAFHPQDNNIIAIGMEDSTIHIYNVRVDEVINTIPVCIIFLWIISFSPLNFVFQVKTRLKGHQKRITGLAFSTNLGVLVSSGADAQVTIISCLCLPTPKKRISVLFLGFRICSGSTSSHKLLTFILSAVRVGQWHLGEKENHFYTNASWKDSFRRYKGPV